MKLGPVRKPLGRPPLFKPVTNKELVQLVREARKNDIIATTLPKAHSITWNCPSCGVSNPEGEDCEKCGQKQCCE